MATTSDQRPQKKRMGKEGDGGLAHNAFMKSILPEKLQSPHLEVTIPKAGEGTAS